MPIAAAPSTSRRLLALLSLLQSRRDWPAAVLAQRLEVSTRTVRRDVERLRELDYSIEATRGPDGGYRLAPGVRLPPLLLDDEQAVAIAIALRSAAALGAGLEDAAERALATVGRLLPDHLAARVEDLVLTAPVGDAAAVAEPAVLLRIGAAIRARTTLRFDYDLAGTAADAEPREVRRIEPHHLLLRTGRWYLIGYEPDQEEWRILRVDRITPRLHTGRTFPPRTVPGGDAGRFLEARFKGSADADAWPAQGEAVLRLPIAAVAPYVGDGTVEPVDDEHCRVRLGSWSWGALAASLLRFEAELTDIAPAALRDAFAVLFARIR